jgi:hypothetical protein
LAWGPRRHCLCCHDSCSERGNSHGGDCQGGYWIRYRDWRRSLQDWDCAAVLALPSSHCLTDRQPDYSGRCDYCCCCCCDPIAMHLRCSRWTEFGGRAELWTPGHTLYPPGSKDLLCQCHVSPTIHACQMNSQFSTPRFNAGVSDSNKTPRHCSLAGRRLAVGIGLRRVSLQRAACHPIDSSARLCYPATDPRTTGIRRVFRASPP